MRPAEEFIEAGLKDRGPSPWESLVAQIFLGGQDFVRGMCELAGDRQRIGEIPKVQRFATRPSLSELFSDATHKDKARRNAKIIAAHVEYGYTLKEIADCLRLHYTTVGKAAARQKQKQK